MGTQSKAFTWIGSVLTGLVALGLSFSGSMKLISHPEVLKEMGRLGYPKEVIIFIGVAELVCLILYLIPRTAVLGAVLLTGYLGGATATHVRLTESFVPPVIIGVLVWLAMYFRDRRVRALLPLRGPTPPTQSN